MMRSRCQRGNILRTLYSMTNWLMMILGRKLSHIMGTSNVWWVLNNKFTLSSLNDILALVQLEKRNTEWRHQEVHSCWRRQGGRQTKEWGCRPRQVPGQAQGRSHDRWLSNLSLQSRGVWGHRGTRSGGSGKIGFKYWDLKCNKQ